MKVCECDNGLVYTMAELGDVIGIKYHSVVQRIRMFGWDSPLIMAPKGSCRFRLDGSPNAHGAASGNKDWQALSSKPRENRLSRVGSSTRR